ncbi:hypothetical protein CLOM_g22835 [Closterium sp. NIES-68]|nr:hypothetical protein CLOM_g22835 [Closterium sp. NIES-68]GJP82603.1 hypothetical protein CLOP_g12842 [Closterium sp. NIES-67]
MADSEFDPSAAAARQRRMDLRRKKATTPSGLIVCRKHLGVGLLPQKRDTSDDSSTNSSLSSSFPLSPSSLSPPHANSHPSADPITAAAYTALRTKFRRSQFRRPRKGKGEDSASAEGSSGSKSPRGVNGQRGDGGGGGGGGAEDGGADEDSSSDLSSETSSSGTTDSSGDGNDAEVDAAISVAASLLQEETKLQHLGMDGVPGAGGAAADATAFAPLPPRVIPPSTCSGGRIKGAAADECPGNGVLSVCGRRREMEDAVAMVPAFALVPCASRAGCSLGGGEASGGQGADDPQCQLHMFAVFDGHGGSQAANFLSAHMSNALAEELSITLSGIEPLPPATPDPAPSAAAATGAEGGAEGAQKADPVLQAHWQRAMVQSFARMDAEISGHCFLRRSHCHGASADAGEGGAGGEGGGMVAECVHEPLAAETVGSTSVVLVVTAHHLVVGNCGDSRAVLCRGGKAVPLSKDHKPEREDEMKRVEKAGGRVIFWNGYRVLGVLAMSRAIGDRYLKPYVIPEPEVTLTQRHPDDELVVLASDGLWDVISNEAAVDIARRCLAQRGGSGGSGSTGAAPEAPAAGDETAAAAAETLAAAGAQGEEEMSPAALAAAVLTKLALVRGSGDNISVVVVDLRGTR